MSDAENPFWMETSRYPICATETPDERGSRLRTLRRSLGLDIGTAAKQLRIPAPTLVLLELGRIRFTDPADYTKASQSLRTKHASAARSGPSQSSNELSNLSSGDEAKLGSTPGGGTNETETSDSERTDP